MRPLSSHVIQISVWELPGEIQSLSSLLTTLIFWLVKICFKF